MRRTTLKTWLVMWMFCLTIVGTAAGQIIYVDADANGANDGLSWTDAYNHLQDALADANAAAKPVEIRVAEGLYTPDSNADDPNGSGDRAASFQLINGVTIRGAYAGFGEADPNARDFEQYETILTGDLDGNDVDVNDPCDLPTEPNRAENSYHVVTGSGTDANAVLDGFTITRGNATGVGFPHYLGGGMLNRGSDTSPTVFNCTFTGNAAGDYGGGMYNDNNSSPTVTDCSFSGNSAANEGGGMYNYDRSSPTVTNCTFTHNSADYGGGMNNYSYCSPTVTDCNFSKNSATSYGGGMFNDKDSNTILTNCTFSANMSDEGAGGMANWNSSPIVTDCNFTGNNAVVDGGGMYNHYNSSPTVTDCNFTGNSAFTDGGGMYNYESSPTVTDCNFTGNTGRWGGGMLNSFDSSPTVTDCNFAGNTADDGGGMCNYDNSSPTVTDCNFTDNSASTDGGGMLNYMSSPMVTSCTFTGNSGYEGGGMFNHTSGNPAVTNCTFSGNIADANGGGMFNDPNSSPTVTDCNFSNNSANDGGGMYNNGSSPTLTDCNFGGNTATWNAGGIYNTNSSPAVTNCSFSNNTATNAGGGMCNFDNSSPTVTECTFTANNANYGPGGMLNWDSSPTVTGCSFTDNTAPVNGGAMCNVAGTPTITDCTFNSNDAQYGGGMYNNQASPTVTNCIFINNSASTRGGGMINQTSSSPTVINCTFSGNSGGGMSNYGDGGASYPTVTNCILWGDTPDEIYNILGSTPTVTYSDVQGGYTGTGNINTDPLFVDCAAGNLRLSSSASPCVDAGDNNSVPPDTADLDGDGNTVELIPWDLDGGARIVDGNSDGNSVVDMGAYERRGRIYVDVDAGGPVHDGANWANAYKYLQDGLADADSGVKPVEIWVAEGTYKPDANASSPDGTGDRDAAFHLIDHVTLTGGFAGYGEPNSDARDIELYETILSGDLDGNDADINQPWALSYDANRGENSYHVVVAFEVDSNAVLDGFTITGGYANGFSEEDASGGGMLCSNASPMVLNCTFIMNSAGSGGGMANLGGHPVVTGCTFRTNVAEGGGGMVNFEVNPPMTITNCSFVGNAAMVGAAVGNVLVDSAMTNCRFSGNAAAFVGGAVYNEASNSLMTNCTFGGNYASEDVGGAVFDSAGQLALINSILWCDGAADGNEIAVVGGSTVDVNYCDVKGGQGDVFDDGGSGTVNWGPGNIEEDPRFVAPGYWGEVNDTNIAVEPDDPNAVWVDGDYRLLAGSPCIDTADNNSVPEDTVDLDGDGNTVEVLPWDLDGEPRTKDGDGDGDAVVDMGAYEVAIAPVPPVLVTMKFTPEALNTCSKGKAYAHFVWPQGSVEGEVTDTPATLNLLGTEVVSEDIKVLADAHGLVRVKIAFRRAALCGVTTDHEYAEVIVTGTLSSGRQFRGTDVIKIND